MFTYIIYVYMFAVSTVNELLTGIRVTLIGNKIDNLQEGI